MSQFNTTRVRLSGVRVVAWFATIVALLATPACVSVPELLAHDRVHPATLLVENEAGACSGTAVGPNVLLTATHCLAYPLVAINGVPVVVVAQVDDNEDHSLVTVDITFKQWATIAPNGPRVGQGIFIWGNPGSFRNLLRFGTVSGWQTGVLLLDIHGWPGDSGAGVFNDEGELVGVISIIAGEGLFYQMGMFRMAFTAEQLPK